MMKQLLAFLLLTGVLFMTGCSNIYSEEDGYRMAVINQGFPIPKNAYEVKPEECTIEISKAAKYRLKNIGDEQGNPPPDYLREIESWGWNELADERRGTIHYYEKNGKIMSLNIQQNVFDVFEMSNETP